MWRPNAGELRRRRQREHGAGALEAELLHEPMQNGRRQARDDQFEVSCVKQASEVRALRCHGP